VDPINAAAMLIVSHYRRYSKDNEEQPGANDRKLVFFTSAVFFSADNITLR
jgi:hypothetical protein